MGTLDQQSEEHRQDRGRFGRSAALFTVCRYTTYVFMLTRSILTAKFLGPYLLGIFGLLSLVLQYLAYTGLGLQFAINVEIATKPNSDHRETISAALTLTAVISLLVVLTGLLIQTLKLNIFPKYSFQNYALIVGITAGATLIQQVFTNLFRVHGRLAEIALAEGFSAILLLTLTLIFRETALVRALVIGLSVSAIFAIALFMIRAPFRYSLTMNRSAVRTLLAIGLPLLAFNASFYLITMVAQSTVSIYYPLEAMGYYTLASGIANVALLGFSSISFIAYPTVLRRTRLDLPGDEVASVIDRVNLVFGTSVFLLVLAVILMLPLLFLILPKYKPAGGAVIVLLLSQALLQSSFGFNCLAIARNKQMEIAKVAVMSVIVVAIFAGLAGRIGLPFIWVAIAVLVGAILFSLQQARVGNLLLEADFKVRPVLNGETYAAVGLCLMGVLTGYTSTGAVLATVIYLAASRNRVREMWLLMKPYIAALLRKQGRQKMAAAESA